MVFLSFFHSLLMLLSLYPVTSSRAGVTEAPKIYHHSEPGLRFQQMDEDRTTGELYFMDQFNVAYKFSTEMELTKKEIDGGKNSYGKNAESLQQVMAYNQEEKLLLACSPDSCGLLDTSSARNWTSKRLNAEVKANRFANGPRTLVTTVSLPVREGETSHLVYYVASEDDGSLNQSTIAPVLSARKLSENKTSFEYETRKPNYATIEVSPKHRNEKRWKVRPVFLGIASTAERFLAPGAVKPVMIQYGYFVSVQTSGQESNPFVTRIGRFCVGDNSLGSYIEMSMDCRGNHLYPLAVSASLLETGNGSWMSVTFTKHLPGTWDAAPDKPRATCLFSLEKINAQFLKQAQDCYGSNRGRRNQQSTSLSSLAWITDIERKCQQTAKTTLKDYCYPFGRQKNVYIAGNHKFSGTAFMEMSDARAVHLVRLPRLSPASQQISLGVMYVSNHTLHLAEVVAAASTSSSDISKSSHTILASVPTQIRPRAFRSPAVHLPSKLTQNGTVYVVTSETTIQTFPVGCGMHETCNLCLSSHQRLGCSWCGNRCLAISDCRQRGLRASKGECPPVITEIRPQNGSIFGGTVLTVKGHSFGSAAAVVKVKVAGQSCELLSSRTPTSLTCKTAPVKAGIATPVAVEVDEPDSDASFSISGEHSYGERPFQYLEPTIDGFQPSFGPAFGGTKVTITGKNLLLGNKQLAKVAGTSCDIIAVNNTVIVCRTGASDYVRKGPVELAYDDSAMSAACASGYFEYKENPVIRVEDNKKKVLASGGHKIAFTGDNLGSLPTLPNITITAYSNSGKMLVRTEKCAGLTADGLGITCRVPVLEDADISAVNATIDLLVDESHNHTWSLTLVADPEIPSPNWPEELVTSYSAADDGYRVVITGSHFNEVLTKNDYVITVEEDNATKCDVATLSEKKIVCVFRNIDEWTGKTPALYVSWAIRAPVLLGKVKFAEMEMVAAVTQPLPASDSILIAAMVVGAILVTSAIICVCSAHRKRRQAGKHPRLSTSKSDKTPLAANLLYDQSPSPSGASSLMDEPRIRDLIETFRRDDLMIDSPYLAFGDLKGHGNFGSVYRGYLRDNLEPSARTRPVAIKVLQDAKTVNSLEEFLTEGLNMKDLRHKNVMPLYGICLARKDSPIHFYTLNLVMPFMEKGDLHSYIVRKIAEGMAYLSTQKIIHRDLAARNCMMDEKTNIKIADFGHSRDIYESQIYLRSPTSEHLLPIRWTAPECLQNFFTSNSDVWSFAVVVWELLEQGQTPYVEMATRMVLDYIKAGFRLQKPQRCPDELYSLMMECWRADPETRPDFADLAVRLQNMQNTATHLFGQNGAAQVYVNDEYLNARYIKCPGTAAPLLPVEQ